jgi:hypothetical protein
MGRGQTGEAQAVSAYSPERYAELVASGIDPGYTLPLNEDRIRHAITRTPCPPQPTRKDRQ